MDRGNPEGGYLVGATAIAGVPGWRVPFVLGAAETSKLGNLLNCATWLVSGPRQSEAG